MEALTAVILSLLTVFSAGPVPIYAYHLRSHELGAHARAEQLAWQLQEASDLSGVDVALLMALEKHESAFDHSRKREHGEGALQLNPYSPWGRSWKKDCKNARRAGFDMCEDLNIMWGALALRDGLQQCKSKVKAIGFYRTGKCVEGPKGWATVKLSYYIKWKLKMNGYKS